MWSIANCPATSSTSFKAITIMGTIQVVGVGKAYRRYRSQWARAGDLLSLGRLANSTRTWVLKDISFSVQAGESVGIIGQNGAGKSTLLKIITGTVAPTEGSVSIGGNVAALLELGMGFHPDFTGRQNAYMSGQLLGLSVPTITEKMGEIEAFADIGDYIDQPIRTYSSGMVVRLAFSVATVVRPEVLIVDEALAVGDVFFQQKCYERIRAFVSQGTTLLFVSHGAQIILELCDRAILLDHGRLALDGSPKDVIDLYQANSLAQLDGSAVAQAPGAPRPATAVTPLPVQEVAPTDHAVTAPMAVEEVTVQLVHGDAELVEGGFFSASGQPIAAARVGDDIIVRVAYRSHRALPDPHVGFRIRNRFGVVLYESNTYCLGARPGRCLAGQVVSVDFRVRLRLGDGEYTLTTGFANGGKLGDQFDDYLGLSHSVASLNVAKAPGAAAWSGLIDLEPVATSQVSSAA
jgi:lipopolysaccharide transport system ATP-binding protein